MFQRPGNKLLLSGITKCGECSIRVFIRPSSAPNDSLEAKDVTSDDAGKSHTIACHKQLRSMPLSQSFRSSIKSTHSKASKKVIEKLLDCI